MTKQLHQNTGKHFKDVVLFKKIYLSFNCAEDPEVSWWKRRWASYCKDGFLDEYTLCLKKTTSEDGLKAYFIYFLMFQIGIAVL